MKRTTLRSSPRVGKRRGVALLLVMIGLVVCTLLTAGFLSTQGTSIAIARNERDAEQCRMLAQAGIDLCFAQIRALDTARTTADQPGWREKMSPGTWLSNFAIGSGTVTVAAHSAGSTDSFTADYHEPIVLTSTGYANNRQFTLTATISPTGGGEVFRGGNYFAGNVVVGSSGLPLLTPTATVDSYNSGVGPYTTSGSKAVVWTNSTSSNSITVNVDSVLNGSVLAGPNSLLSAVVNLLGTLLGGNSNVAAASEPRDPGVVVPPNTTGLTDMGPISQSNGPLAPGVYDGVSITAHSGPAVSFTNGVYVDKGNLTVALGSQIVINGNTTLYVTGSVSLASTSAITVNTGSSLTLIVGGTTTISGATVTSAGSNPLPSQVQILGLSTASSIQVSGGSTIAGVIYAPKASVQMKNTSVVQGAVVAHDVTLLNTAKFHYDEATKSIKISNISGGTAPPGAADYTIAVH